MWKLPQRYYVYDVVGHLVLELRQSLSLRRVLWLAHFTNMDGQATQVTVQMPQRTFRVIKWEHEILATASKRREHHKHRGVDLVYAVHVAANVDALMASHRLRKARIMTLTLL